MPEHGGEASATATTPSVSVGEIERAAETIRGLVRETPMLAAGEVSRRFGAVVRLKAESLQRTGSFKLRGATNRIAALTAAELEAGVVAASAGNHAQAVAVAAAQRGAAADLFMPAHAPVAKIAAVRGYGGSVRLVDGSYDDAYAAAREFAAAEGRTLVHAFDDAAIVAGQGTVGLEIAAQAAATRLVIAPLGGGSLAAGTAIAIKAMLPGVRVVGVQAEACAPYGESLAAGHPVRAGRASTICDGIAVKRPGDLTLPLVGRYLDEVVTVSDDEVAEAMVLLLERSKLVVEGAGAVSVAALLAGKVEAPAEGETCAILSGGNVDASRLAECIRLGETSAGRRLVFSTVVPDLPGALARLLRVVAEADANVLDVAHLREGMELHVRETGVRLVLQTEGRAHAERIVALVEAEGFHPSVERARI